ncbi:hypothetical protein MSKU15_3517 [Komagataeibacter diospyri]|nr:hypothetical protein MSKU15_3517 [Komagataeibacter diospyri]
MGSGERMVEHEKTASRAGQIADRLLRLDLVTRR